MSVNIQLQENSSDNISYFENGMKLCFMNFHNFDECLKDHDGIVITVGVILAVVFFAIERHIDRKHRKKEFVNSCETILEELRDHSDMYHPEKYIKDEIKDNADLCFVDRHLNIDAYESIIHSGFFTRFRPYTQFALSNLYLRIKLRNDLVAFRRQCRYQFFSSGSGDRDAIWPICIRETDKKIFKWDTEIKFLVESSRKYLTLEKSLAQTMLPRLVIVYLERRKQD
jgi:hypothetical protein